MKGKLPLVVRILLGLIFVVFGLNGFLHFMPMPPMSGPAGAFMGGLAGSGYMFPLIKAVEVVAGALLLSGMYVPLALILLAPGIVNIVLFHSFLAPSGLPMALVILAAEVYLAYTYRKAYAPLFKKK